MPNAVGITLRSGRQLQILGRQIDFEDEMADFDDRIFASHIPMYSGELGKLHSFLRKCDTFRNNLKEGEKATFFNRIIFKLDGRAFDVIQEANPADYDAFKKALSCGIYAGRSVKDLDRKLENMRQYNLSVYEYAQRASELVTEYKRIIGDLETDEKVKIYRNKEVEKKAARYFKEGLNEPLKTRVLASSIDLDLKKTIDLAMEEEPYAKKNQWENRNYFPQPNNQFNYETRGRYQPNNYRPSNNFNQQNRYRNNYDNANRGSNNFFNQDINPYRNNPNLTNQSKDIICYKCNKRGHIARDCRVNLLDKEKRVRCLQEDEIWEEEPWENPKNESVPEETTVGNLIISLPH